MPPGHSDDSRSQSRSPPASDAREESRPRPSLAQPQPQRARQSQVLNRRSPSFDCSTQPSEPLGFHDPEPPSAGRERAIAAASYDTNDHPTTQHPIRDSDRRATANPETQQPRPSTTAGRKVLPSFPGQSTSSTSVRPPQRLNPVAASPAGYRGPVESQPSHNPPPKHRREDDPVNPSFAPGGSESGPVKRQKSGEKRSTFEPPRQSAKGKERASNNNAAYTQPGQTSRLPSNTGFSPQHALAGPQPSNPRLVRPPQNRDLPIPSAPIPYSLMMEPSADPFNSRRLTQTSRGPLIPQQPQASQHRQSTFQQPQPTLPQPQTFLWRPPHLRQHTHSSTTPQHHQSSVNPPPGPAKRRETFPGFVSASDILLIPAPSSRGPQGGSAQPTLAGGRPRTPNFSQYGDLDSQRDPREYGGVDPSQHALRTAPERPAVPSQPEVPSGPPHQRTDDSSRRCTACQRYGQPCAWSQRYNICVQCLERPGRNCNLSAPYANEPACYRCTRSGLTCISKCLSARYTRTCSRCHNNFIGKRCLYPDDS
ncbi:hypothetical protein GE09DRAFT_57453 [Coniochaeta sp. 2T2.1]|nr:hypothetical protein GE09DRAFT_57453 [Coniochaeta sp. 2T2.1]